MPEERGFPEIKKCPPTFSFFVLSDLMAGDCESGVKELLPRTPRAAAHHPRCYTLNKCKVPV